MHEVVGTAAALGHVHRTLEERRRLVALEGVRGRNPYGAEGRRTGRYFSRLAVSLWTIVGVRARGR